MDYNQIVSIDESNLRKSWLEQAPRYMELVVAEADAKRQVSDLKEKLDVVMAERGSGYRKEADEAQKKLTEAALQQLLNADIEVQKAKAELRNAEYQKDIISGARTAMEHRRDALGNLVQMNSRGNYAEPKAQGETQETTKLTFDEQRRAANPIRPPAKK